MQFKHNIHLFEKDPIDHTFQKACFAEFLAMVFFVLVGMGAAMGAFSVEDSFPYNQNQVAMAIGFGIMVLAQFSGPLSGGHMNCAVSFGLFWAGRISAVRLVAYIVSQLLGSLSGAFLLYCIFGKNWTGAGAAFGANAWDPDVFTSGAVFMAEALCTGLLVINVLATIDIPSPGGGALGVLPISITVMYAHYLLIPITGCSINPARSFGPSVMASMVGIKGRHEVQLWMFFVAPLFGAFMAAFVYEYGSLKPRARDVQGRTMKDAVFENPSAKSVDANRGTVVPSTEQGVQLVDQVYDYEAETKK